MKAHHRVLVVDSFAIVRKGLFLLIEEEFAQPVVIEAKSATQALQLLREQQRFDLVIIGDNLPDLAPEKLIRIHKQDFPEDPVLIFAENFSYPSAITYFINGANGYITKLAEKKDIIQALRSLCKGKPYFSFDLLRAIAEEKLMNLQNPAAAQAHLSEHAGKPGVILSKRQQEIVNHLVQGQSTSHIARVLQLKISTVSTHKTQIFNKLGVDNVLALRDLVNVRSRN